MLWTLKRAAEKTAVHINRIGEVLHGADAVETLFQFLPIQQKIRPNFGKSNFREEPQIFTKFTLLATNFTNGVKFLIQS